MLITISVPDNTVGIYFSTQQVNENDYVIESDPQKITFDMIYEVEQR